MRQIEFAYKRKLDYTVSLVTEDDKKLRSKTQDYIKELQATVKAHEKEIEKLRQRAAAYDRRLNSAYY